jgi:hypothetical protein
MVSEKASLLNPVIVCEERAPKPITTMRQKQ